jgi:hypothetical protein
MTTGMTAKKLVRGTSIILLIIVILGYGVWKSQDVLFGIKLTVTGIKDGMTATNPLVTFGGVAKHVKDIMVDGRIVPTAQDGSWSDTVALLPGYNVITVTAADKFNRTKSTQYRLFYDAPFTAPAIKTIPPSSPTLEKPQKTDTAAASTSSTTETASLSSDSGVQ